MTTGKPIVGMFDLLVRAGGFQRKFFDKHLQLTRAFERNGTENSLKASSDLDHRIGRAPERQ
jgi:hypothetical protein